VKFINALTFVQVSDLQLQLAREEEGKGGEESKVINPKILCYALLTVCTVDKVEVRNAQSIAMASFLPAHHPYISQC
jgi:hypothetical protein